MRRCRILLGSWWHLIHFSVVKSTRTSKLWVGMSSWRFYAVNASACALTLFTFACYICVCMYHSHVGVAVVVPQHSYISVCGNSLCVVNFTVEMWSVNSMASAMTCRLVLFELTRGACAVRTRWPRDATAWHVWVAYIYNLFKYIYYECVLLVR